MATKKAFPLRLDPKLYDALRRWSEQEFRSVNGQIEFLLRDAVQKRFGPLRDEGSADRREPKSPDDAGGRESGG